MTKKKKIKISTVHASLFIAATFKIDPLCCSFCTQDISLHGNFIDNWRQRIVISHCSTNLNFVGLYYSWSEIYRPLFCKAQSLKIKILLP